ncbi:hypothetical protein BEWA_012690 [Theileria equi strain WA]|uniref:Uncharacterized protein n=1 Tax=Theileria equi strain WA TaxID=1537102 RepID=L1LBR8_THEEQ|nr:hypothetical protein BEWA_012690 [Theileria equi strain WA]EKX72710.1 hypothetical protein BEWA_012690 [Theileria equi strain WA]|eukprot:XP_004832162.1 hypothetical protein BEWA_012690 [Theileria equi strain WA]
MSTGELKLNVKCQGGDKGQCTCKGAENIPGLKAEKRTNIPVPGFTKYVHWIPGGSGGTFTLDGELKDGGKIGSEGKIPIHDVKEVSVYYWNGNPSKNILLGITKKIGDSDDTTTTYYSKSSDGNDWNISVNALGELQALDDFNCRLNNAVPFEIQGSQSGSTPKESKSECIESKNTKPTGSPPPPSGSNYTIKSQKITDESGKDAIISRLTLNGTPINISLTREYIGTEIRLYSSLVNKNVPLMLEFKPPGNGKSRWFYSQNKDGNSWQEDAGHGFYSDNGQLCENLAKKLDDFTCQNHNGVTIDLSHKTSIAQQRYCCNEHGGKGKNNGKIYVKSVPVTCKKRHNESSVTAYIHSIGSGNTVAGIKFYSTTDSGNRKKVSANALKFPIDGPVDIYTFYSSDSLDPVLIYVDSSRSKNPKAKTGWYRKSRNGYDSPWTKLRKQLRNITHHNFRDLGCLMWNSLVKVLKKRGCGTLTECPRSPELARADDLSEESEEDEEEKKPKVEGTSGSDGPQGGAYAPTVPPKTPTPARSVGAAPLGLMAIFKISSGVFGGSGAVGLAGYHLYKNSRDPWVRQMSVYGSSRGTLDTSLSTE